MNFKPPDRLRLISLCRLCPEPYTHRCLDAQVLINNAGVLVYTDFDGVTAEDLLRCFTVNAVGPLLVAQQLHRRGLIGGRGGATLVGNVTSKVKLKLKLERPGGVSEVMGLGSPLLSVYDL